MFFPYSNIMITKDQFRRFVQSKEEAILGIITPPTLYYLRVFEAFGQKKFFLSWNWAAFSAAFLPVGHLWFAYRRMYVVAGIYWLLSNGLLLGFARLGSYILPHFIKLEGANMSLKIGYGLTTLLLSNMMGALANTLYFANMRYSLKRNIPGGTNPTAALVALIISLLITSLIKRFGAPYL
jgi:hypothetical protein